MQFEYNLTTVVNATLDIEDLGNASIIANDDKGNTFDIIIRTILGKTEIFECGPRVPDIDGLQPTESQRYRCFEFNEFKIKKAINAFLNGTYFVITQARVVELEEARALFVDYKRYI